jgi:glycosyltransferase involved in cell wall biosynthesis
MLKEHWRCRGEKLKGLNRGYAVSDIKKEKYQRNISSNYLLCVSHIFRYKKLLEVIQAYSLARSNDKSFPKLLIAGAHKDRKYAQELVEEIRVLGLTDSVILLGNVERSQLHDLIVNCTASIFSSLVETFPTTLFELMSARVPLIVGDSGVMPHFCDDSVLYYNNADPNDLRNKMLQILGDKSLAAELAQKSYSRYEELTLDWNSALKKRQSLFQSLVAG